MTQHTMSKRMTVRKAFKILSPIAAALFLLTVMLTFQMNSRMRQVLISSANCRCSCTDANTNTKDSTSACGSNCKATNSSLHQRPPGNVKLPSVCVNDSCRYDYVRLLQREGAHPIPEIRHILWRNESVSEYFAEQLSTWQKIHPNWTFVLWRDADMEPFVATYFPGMLAKFRSLPEHIMRVDMIRYMLLYKYGGTYADLDYTLVSSLDRFRHFHAVVTVEPEAHSFQMLGMAWPPKLFASPAFLMSAPGHSFFKFVIQLLESRFPGDAKKTVLRFAGPIGLTELMEYYGNLFPIGNHASDIVFVPPSYSFFPYKDNRLNTSTNIYVEIRFEALGDHCKSLMSSSDGEQRQLRQHHQLVQYCTDVNNMDPITDKSQPVIAVHDLNKSLALCYGEVKNCFTENLRDVRSVLKNFILGRDFMLAAADAAMS